jgi:hypothetical protein
MTQPNQSGQPSTPGTPGYVQNIDAQTARGEWQNQQNERARRQQEQQPGPAYARQQRPVRRSWRFPWRVMAWIATAFALLWTAGVVIDAVSGDANPAAPAIFAVGAAAIALVAFIVAPRRRD